MPELAAFAVGALTGATSTLAAVRAHRARRRRRWDLERAIARDRALHELGRLLTSTPGHRSTEDQSR